MATKTKTEKTVVKTGITEDIVVEKTTTEKNRTIIAKNPVPFRKYATMLKRHEVGQMPAGTAYEIVLEVKNGAGTFYKLNNGMYISAAGNYAIN